MITNTSVNLCRTGLTACPVLLGIVWGDAF